MSYLVALETTGENLGIAVVSLADPRKSKVFIKKNAGKQAEILIPTLQSLLKKFKAGPKDVGLVAVDVGPGSFTGVRVGVSAARAMAQGLQLPLVGIPSLEAAAWAAKVPVGKKVRILASLAALPGEIYWAIYEVRSTRVGKEWRIIQEPCWTQLDAYEKIKRSGHTLQVSGQPHPLAVAQRALKLFEERPRNEFFYENTVPLYLQPSWAERKK